MSTKIYTGFRFKTVSWATVQKHLTAFRQELREVARKNRATKIAQEVYLTLDRKALGAGGPENGKSAYILASKNNRDEEKATPFNFEVVVFPYGRRIYGMTFGWVGYEVIWEKKPFIEEWGYWNNTDRPENVTAREWRHRRDVWDKILGYDSPSMRGFIADCVDAYDTQSSPEDIMASAPEFDDRVRILAADLMFPEYQAEHGGKGLRCFIEFQEWVKREGLSKFQDECKRVGMFLPKKVTKEMLLESG